MSVVTKSLGAWWSDRRSLRWKLPMLFALTASVAVTVFGVVAYGTVRRVALETASTRLMSALSQVRTVQELGVINQLTSLRSASRDTAVIAALRSYRPTPSASVLEVITRLKGVSDSNVVVELVDRQGTVRYALPRQVASGMPKAPALPPDARVGPIEQRGERVVFESTVSVSSASDTLGIIRVTRQLRNGVNRRMVANLLEGAVLLTGNADGAMWSDSGQSRYPVASTGPARYLRHGQRWLSVSAPVRQTPWLYAVELPERLALAPARRLIIPFTVAGLLVAFGAAVVGMRMSHRVTQPLAELTLATEAIARGEEEVPVLESSREDEIGRLTRAFSTMASQVTSRRTSLEQEVTRRTGELSVATGQLLALNQELRESEKLATVGRLSGSAGHELRNPLGVMSNIVFLIDAMPDASRTLKEYAALLREQIRVSDRIISDLLERVRTGAPLRAPVNVARLIDETVQRADLPGDVKVKRDFVLPSQPLVIDRDHVSQILWNLVRNAVQAMNGTGTLSIVARYAEERLRIEVHDTGKGILPDDIERVFQPLYTTKAHGIGLGLSVSRAFARANGGDLSAVAVQGGACFVLEVPASLATAAAMDSSPAPAPGRVRHESPPHLASTP